MNERIRQLLVEAQALAREQVKNTPELAKYAPSYAIPGTQIHVGLGLSYEKFAELIVAECMKLNSKELSITAIERLLPLYREHFGVEDVGS